MENSRPSSQLDPYFSDCKVHSYLGDLVEISDSDSVVLGWGLRFCIFDKPPGVASLVV